MRIKQTAIPPLRTLSRFDSQEEFVMSEMSEPIKLHPMKLIVSEDLEPTVTLKPGMRFEVVSVSVVDPRLALSKAIGSRLCGGSGTYLAIIDIGQDVINPQP
jgi:hypothetical protein